MRTLNDPSIDICPLYTAARAERCGDASKSRRLCTLRKGHSGLHSDGVRVWSRTCKSRCCEHQCQLVEGHNGDHQRSEILDGLNRIWSWTARPFMSYCDT